MTLAELICIDSDDTCVCRVNFDAGPVEIEVERECDLIEMRLAAAKKRP